MKTYIIDTNLCFNMEAGMGLGDTTEGIIRTLTDGLKKADGEIEIMMPPRIIDEIKSFFENPEQPFLLDFFNSVTIKSPSTANQQFNGEVVASLIEEMRQRAYRGMKAAEEEIIRAADQFMGKEVLSKKDFQIATGKIVTKFRERFRTATRTGMIDSLADIDLIMLARETGAILVSSDEGVITWGRRMGVREQGAAAFGRDVQAYL